MSSSSGSSTRITRDATHGVLIECGGDSGWSLVADDPAATWISLIGFRPGPIANACEAHGWPVTVNPPIDAASQVLDQPR